MGTFWTEKETEAYLEPETRDLVMPDGSTRPFTGFRLLWIVFDDLVRRAGYSPARLVELAVQETEVTGVSFDTAFPGVLGYMDRHLLRKRDKPR